MDYVASAIHLGYGRRYCFVRDEINLIIYDSHSMRQKCGLFEHEFIGGMRLSSDGSSGSYDVVLVI